MTLDELEKLIETAHWFEHLGEPLASGEFVQISTLVPWANHQTGDSESGHVIDLMEWLPSSREQDDPIHGKSMEDRLLQHDKKEEYAQRCLNVCKMTLVSLRSFDVHRALKAGPYDFTDAARGAALFAARRAAYEILLSECGFWCVAMGLYQQGHWPCGILATGKVVVL